MKKTASTIFSALLLAASGSHSAWADEQTPVVLELFTSQGCSSCPPADALLQQLAKNPHIIALSFHVHYWDYLGWHDTFASPANTNRQRGYVANLRQNSMFTPQLIVDGTYSAVGSDSADVNGVIAMAAKKNPGAPITLSPDATGKILNVHVGTIATQAQPASVFAVRYRRHADTPVSAGENAGYTLTSINNVTELTKLGAWRNKDSNFQLPLSGSADEGVAILLQNDGQGHIVSAQNYPK